MRSVVLLVTLVCFSLPSVAQEASSEAPVSPASTTADAPVVAPTDGAEIEKKRQQLKELMEKRDQQAQRYADSTGMGGLLDVVGTALTIGAGCGIGIATASLFTWGTPVWPVLAGCGVCLGLGSFAAQLGLMLTRGFLDKRAEEAMKLEAAQRKLDEAVMAF